MEDVGSVLPCSAGSHLPAKGLSFPKVGYRIPDLLCPGPFCPPESSAPAHPKGRGPRDTPWAEAPVRISRHSPRGQLVSPLPWLRLQHNDAPCPVLLFMRTCRTCFPSYIQMELLLVFIFNRTKITTPHGGWVPSEQCQALTQKHLPHCGV